jgi:hypothetical protein
MTKMMKYIDWRNSQAKSIIVDDLDEGLLPMDQNVMSAEEAWESCYRDMEEFAMVPFTQFKERLRDHRKQVKARYEQSEMEADALAHDRLLYPRQSHNHRGEPVFDLSIAKQFLCEDVKNKLHTTMLPSKLQGTRPEYKLFKPNKFKHRIYQEVRRQKFIFYLEQKRSTKVTTNK